MNSTDSVHLIFGNPSNAVTLKDGSVDVATVTYGREGVKNQSLTREPDLTGNLTLHSKS